MHGSKSKVRTTCLEQRVVLATWQRAAEVEGKGILRNSGTSWWLDSEKRSRSERKRAFGRHWEWRGWMGRPSPSDLINSLSIIRTITRWITRQYDAVFRAVRLLLFWFIDSIYYDSVYYYYLLLLLHGVDGHGEGCMCYGIHVKVRR